MFRRVAEGVVIKSHAAGKVSAHTSRESAEASLGLAAGTVGRLIGDTAGGEGTCAEDAEDVASYTVVEIDAAPGNRPANRARGFSSGHTTPVVVKDVARGVTTVYKSQRAAANALGLPPHAIYQAMLGRLESNYKGRYIITRASGIYAQCTEDNSL